MHAPKLTNFPVDGTEFVSQLNTFFAAAVTESRRRLCQVALREQFFTHVPHTTDTIRAILRVWQQDQTILAPELFAAAELAHARHPNIPSFSGQTVVAYTGNTCADAHSITDVGRLIVPAEEWPSDSLFTDFQRIIESRKGG